RKLLVLVVDDNEINRLVACRILASLDLDYDTASGGDEALAKLSENRFDLVLMDCRMPAPDGYEVTRRIRDGEIGGLDRHIPIIALSASAMPSDRDKCFAAGMDDFISKPISLECMRTVLVRNAGSHASPSEGADDFVDLSVLRSLDSLEGRDGASLRSEVVNLFLTNAPDDLKRLDTAIESR